MKWKCLFFLSWCAFLVAPATAEQLYVYVPTDVRAKNLQQAIGMACPNITVTAFGRGIDFRQLVKKSPPDAILSPLPVLEHRLGFKSAIRGVKNGFTDEQYVLLSVDKAFDLRNIENSKIGVVDILGRKAMGEFVSQLMQTKVKLKRVTKQEDLLSLLTFGSVDGVFVSESQYRQIRKRSNLNLVVTNPNIKVGLASIALVNLSAKQKIADCVKRFDKKLNRILGVEQWRIL